MSKKILFCAALVLAIFAGAAQKRQAVSYTHLTLPTIA